MKKIQEGIICLLLLWMSTIAIHAQSWDAVKSSSLYLYGEGYGATVEEADKQALSDLISKIAVNVSSVTNQSDNETVSNGSLTSNSDFKSTIQTYSQATLTNTERIILKNEPDAHVGRWIKKSEIEKIFESRKLKIRSLIDLGNKAEKNLKIDDALRCYYWAYTLLRSLQHPNDMTGEDSDGKQQVLSVWLPEKINSVLDNIQASYIRKNGDDAEIAFAYKGQPVSSLDYTYFDGTGWSNIYSAKDGVGILELPSSSTLKQYQIKYEFEYRGQAHIDPEIESVINTIKSVPFKAAYTNVKAKGGSKANEVLQALSNSTNSSFTLQQPTDGGEKYAKMMAQVADAVRNRNYDAADNLFTPEGLEIYNRLIKYGSAKIVGNPVYKVYQDGNGTVGRGLNMCFSFKNGIRKAFVEDLVFTFNDQGKISNIAFGLGKKAEDDVLGKVVWSETARKAIMDFLENYKTAYALKRLDYIKTIFDDDAVIITGRVVKRNPVMYQNPETGATIRNYDIIKYNRQTKDEYIRNLARTFASNEFVNIRFANNDIIKMGKGGEMYAIQIAQDYYSTHYGDKGYLFLMVDINDPKHPLIKVRTWQPEKDPKFGLYGPGDF